jgi:alanyl-tRNA synthetase
VRRHPCRRTGEIGLVRVLSDSAVSAGVRRIEALTGDAARDESRDIGGVKYLGKVVTGVAPKELKGLVDAAKASLGSGVAAFVAVSEDGKASVVVGVTEDLTSRLSAVDLVRAASEAIGGKGGGGRPDMAQAGGPDGVNANAAIDAVAAALS